MWAANVAREYAGVAASSQSWVGRLCAGPSPFAFERDCPPHEHEDEASLAGNLNGEARQKMYIMRPSYLLQPCFILYHFSGLTRGHVVDHEPLIWLNKNLSLMECGLRDNCRRVCGSARSAVYLLHNPAEFRQQYLIPMECPDGIHFSLCFGSLRTPERKFGFAVWVCKSGFSRNTWTQCHEYHGSTISLRVWVHYACTRTHPALFAMQYSYWYLAMQRHLRRQWGVHSVEWSGATWQHYTRWKLASSPFPSLSSNNDQAVQRQYQHQQSRLNQQGAFISSKSSKQRRPNCSASLSMRRQYQAPP